MSVSSADAGLAQGQKGRLGGRLLSRRAKLILVVLVGVLVVALALGLGLGLGLNRGGHESYSPPPPNSPPPTPSALPPTAIWQPAVGSTWQIILSQELKIDNNSPAVTPDVDVFDIDMFLHQNSSVVESLHKLGKKVICYFSGGTYEPYRPDSYRFQQSDIGAVLDGWPDEKWLNISSPSVRKIMADRVDIAIHMGCDAIDPDNMDGYLNDNGLKLKTDDSIQLLKFLADRAKGKNMGIGLKNAPDIIPDVLDFVQFSVNEQCAEQNGCEGFSAFIKAGKPVFHIEYPSGAGKKIAAAASKDSCTAKGMSGFSTVMKTNLLNSWVEYCDGKTASTNVVS